MDEQPDDRGRSRGDGPHLNAPARERKAERARRLEQEMRRNLLKRKAQARASRDRAQPSEP